MMVSKYCKNVKVDKNIYAVFNSLIMQPVFLTKEKLDNLKNDFFNCFSNDEIEFLKKFGIVVKDSKTDAELLKIIKEEYYKNIENKITIMYLIPVNTCNLGCKYCFIGKLNNKEQKMTFDTAKKAIDMFSKHLDSVKEKGEIFFYGAEPLINFDLIEKVVKYINLNNYNIKFSMVSNGLLVNEKIADFIKKYNIGLEISIDGPKNVTDANRVFKNTDLGIYDKLLEKINLLKKYDVDFGLSITVSPTFIENKMQIIEWLKRLNVKNISYNLLHYTYKTDEWKEYYKKAVDFIYYSNLELFDYGFNEDRINRKYKSVYLNEFKYSDCGALGANQITVCPNGDIEICHGYWNKEKHAFPNINSLNDLSELFDLADFKKWKTYLPIFKSKCLKCPAIYLCGGGCAMQSNDLFGDPNNIDKAFCIYSKKMLKYIMKEIYQDAKNSQN